ncbi:MAG: SpoIID/LytB domain-containing protein, partial [Bacillota bacterium]|nr:SpoIID/LytB domain-containing protein [Bacillota bacterium]
YSKYGFNICSSSNCQAYGGYDYEGNTSNLAVDLTNGKIVSYNGKIIYTYYHANSGGYTANSENVWSGSLPYLKAVYDPYSIGSPYSTWALSYTENELVAIIKKNGYNCSSVTDMYIKDFSFDGRAQEMIIETDFEDVVLIKESARRFFGYNELKSIFYSIGQDNKYPVITRSGDVNIDIDGLLAITANGMKNLQTNQSYSILGSDYQKNIAISNKKFNITVVDGVMVSA